MEGMQEPKGKKKWKVAGIVVVIAIAIIIAVCCIYKWNSQGMHETIAGKAPTLIVETPQKISVSNQEIFVLDLLITELGEAWYPAASFSIGFDASRLEFMGVREGNVFVRNGITSGQNMQKLPEWNCNTKQCNETGIINIMYLDMTGGKNSFGQELLSEDDNVVLRLGFRLRGSARVGDVYDLIVEDAVFAASDETQSLSVLQDTLKTKDGRIVIGE